MDRTGEKNFCIPVPIVAKGPGSDIIHIGGERFMGTHFGCLLHLIARSVRKQARALHVINLSTPVQISRPRIDFLSIRKSGKPLMHFT